MYIYILFIYGPLEYLCTCCSSSCATSLSLPASIEKNLLSLTYASSSSVADKTKESLKKKKYFSCCCFPPQRRINDSFIQLSRLTHRGKKKLNFRPPPFGMIHNEKKKEEDTHPALVDIHLPSLFLCHHAIGHESFLSYTVSPSVFFSCISGFYWILFFLLSCLVCQKIKNGDTVSSPFLFHLAVFWFYWISFDIAIASHPTRRPYRKTTFFSLKLKYCTVY